MLKYFTTMIEVFLPIICVLSINGEWHRVAEERRKRRRKRASLRMPQ